MKRRAAPAQRPTFTALLRPHNVEATGRCAAVESLAGRRTECASAARADRQPNHPGSDVG